MFVVGYCTSRKDILYNKANLGNTMSRDFVGNVPDDGSVDAFTQWLSFKVSFRAGFWNSRHSLQPSTMSI